VAVGEPRHVHQQHLVVVVLGLMLASQPACQVAAAGQVVDRPCDLAAGQVAGRPCDLPMVHLVVDRPSDLAVGQVAGRPCDLAAAAAAAAAQVMAAEHRSLEACPAAAACPAATACAAAAAAAAGVVACACPAVEGLVPLGREL
jgi:hypothetical protein